LLGNEADIFLRMQRYNGSQITIVTSDNY